ncbi:carboxypeptidase regulatory-like domain-containing protein [bacterium]|nr:carboxypeptidase regulatory-like domain-containing protein [bacterium]
MKRAFLVFGLVLLFAATGFAFNEAALEQAQNTDNPTDAQRELLEAYSQWESGQNQIDHMGGPDAAGYIFMDSQEAGGPTFDWIDLTATGTVIDSLWDTNYVGPYPIGFSFPFYGSTYTEFWVHSDGAIAFVDYPSSIGLGNDPLPSTDVHGPTVCFFWDDMDPGDPQGGHVNRNYYETMTIGTQQALVLHCDDFAEYGTNYDQLDVNVILFEDGTIKIQYDDVDVDLDINGETIGIQNLDGSDPGVIALEASYNADPADYPFNQLAIQFEQLTPDATLDGTVTELGSGDPIVGADVTYGSFSTTTDDFGYYSFADLYSGTTNTLSVSMLGYFPYESDITLAVGANTQDVTLEMIPPPDYLNSFEVNGDPFFDDGNGEWEWGEPVNLGGDHDGPGSAFDGTNAWATNLDGVHTDTGGNRWLTSGYFELGDAPVLSYYHWFDYNDNYDGYNFNISLDGGDTWILLQPDIGYSGLCSYTGFTDQEVFYNDETPPTPGEMEWAQVTYDLSAYANETVVFGFQHIASTVVSYYGVCFDYVQGWDLMDVPPPQATVDISIITGADVPAEGGEIVYNLFLENNTGMVQTANLWLSATLPNMSNYNIWNYNYTFLPGYAAGEGMVVDVPAFAPAGDYMLTINLGVFPNFSLYNDSEPFNKAAAGVASTGDFNLSGSKPVLVGTAIAADEAEATVVPTEFELGQAYPNPFNPTANFSVSLPEAADLNVRVFNVMGQQVAELANSRTNAGVHNFTFNGANLSSGVYFIQAQVPGQLNAIQKVTLMK